MAAEPSYKRDEILEASRLAAREAEYVHCFARQLTETELSDFLLDRSEYLPNGENFKIDKDRTLTAFIHSKEAGLTRLMSSADRDARSYDAALYLVAECIRQNVEVPAKARDWAASAITRQIPRPKDTRAKSINMIERDKIIISMIENVNTKIKLSALSNVDTGGTSACNAVATALRQINFSPTSYPGIKKIWTRRGSKDTPNYPYWRSVL